MLLTLLLSTTARSVGAGVTREDDTAQRRDVEAAPTKNRQYDCDAKGGRRAATMLALRDGIASSDLKDESLELNLTLQSTRTPRQARPVAHGFVQATQRKTKLGSKLVAIYVFATYNKNPNTDGTCVIKTGDFAFGESPIPRANPPRPVRERISLQAITEGFGKALPSVRPPGVVEVGSCLRGCVFAQCAVC